MRMEMETCGEATIVRVLEDRIDAAGAIQFKEQMRELTVGSQGRVVLDMGLVAFLDSSGLGAVVAAMKALGPAIRLELAALTPTVGKVFRLTRMDSVFIIHDQLPEDLRHAS
jgi:anti-sigma B factor antagonist